MPGVGRDATRDYGTGGWQPARLSARINVAYWCPLTARGIDAHGAGCRMSANTPPEAIEVGAQYCRN